MVFATNFFMNMVKIIEQVPSTPEVTKIFDLSNVIYTSGGSDYFQLDTSNFTVVRSIAMKDDGTSIYPIQQSGYIERLDMSTAYDISTASATGDSVTITPATAFGDASVDANGENWYFAENSSNPYDQSNYWTTSTGWDLSGLTKNASIYQTDNGSPIGIHQAGTKLFISNGLRIEQVDISSGWGSLVDEGTVDITTHSNLVGTINITNTTGIGIPGLFMNSDGTKLITLMTKNSGATCNLVQFSLSTPYDILGSSSIIVKNEFDLVAAIPVADRSSSTQGFQAMVIDRDTESHIYLSDILSDKIFHLKMNPIPKIFSLSNVTYTSGGSDYFVLDSNTFTLGIDGLVMEDDGTAIYPLISSGYMEKHVMSTPYDISTASATGVSVTLPGSISYTDMWVDETGKNWYMSLSSAEPADDTYYFSTATGWDISNLSLVSSDNLGQGRSYGCSSAIGNKIFVSSENQKIKQYDISNGFSNASYEGEIDLDTSSNINGTINILNVSPGIYGMRFNQSGTKTIILFGRSFGSDSNLVELSLSTPFDLVGSSQVTVLNELDLVSLVGADKFGTNPGSFFKGFVIDRETESHLYISGRIPNDSGNTVRRVIYHFKMN